MPNLRYLYKFRHFANEVHLRILTDDEIFFSSARHFNDPFDCRVPIRYDQGTRDEIVAYWSRFLANEFPQATQPQRQRMAEEIFDSGRFRTPEGLETATRLSEQFGTTRMGIFSLSPNYRNILMWSHYSISHSGFAVGFLTQDLRNLSLSYTAATRQIMLLHRVNYSKQYPLLNAYRNSNQERMEGQLLTKADNWDYEDEYRILLQDAADTAIRIPYDLVSRVILGCQVTDTDKNRMIAILRNRRDKPTLFQAVKADRLFALDFRRVSY